MTRVLLLAGSSEGRELAEHLIHDPEVDLISSIAGRLTTPTRLPGQVRIGGFGGVQGLINYLKTNQIAVLLDATHPFAAQMAAHAATACAALNLPLIALTRPPWTPEPGDLWTTFPTIDAAANSLIGKSTRIFLTTGRQTLAPFAANQTSWFLIRAIDPPDPPLPPRHHILLDRGPFTLANELGTLKDHRINLLVTKNSGGAAAAPKLQAARTLGIPVLMIDPPKPPTHIHTVPEALAELAKVKCQ